MQLKIIILLVICISACARRPLAPLNQPAPPVASIQPEAPKLDPKIAQRIAPGLAHQRLKELVGEWNYEVKMWTDPSRPALEGRGQARNQMIHGGRFLATQSTSPGYEGQGIIGFDNLLGRYSSVWIDSMNTGMAISTGKWNSKLNAIVEQGTSSDPILGKKLQMFRSVLTMPKDNTYSYSMYLRGKKGREFKAIEVVYHRK